MDFPITALGTFSNSRHYASWRKQKLDGYRTGHINSPVNIADPFRIREDERAAIIEHIRRRNFAVYRLDPEMLHAPQAIISLCRQLGLVSTIGNPESGQNHVSYLHDRTLENENHSRYKPYTSQPLNWHTDGYYYPEQHKVRSFVLHCSQAAQSGGENILIDHEMLYMEMCNQAPDLANSLCLPDTLTIPENVEQGRVVREAFQGPVFSADDGHLYMRFTQRKRHIVWKQNPPVTKAVALLNSMLASPLPWKATVRLERGEGLLCNNIVHCRNAYSDSAKQTSRRLLYRIRFKERLDTQYTQIQS